MTQTPAIVATAFAVLLIASSATAQTDPHRPPGSAPASPTPPTAATPSAPSSPGIGMPGGGMGLMGMMKMMGQGGPGMADMGMHGMGMRGMAMADRVEGRISFLKAELKITDAQGKAWNDFAQSLRDNARRLGDVRAAVMKGAPSPRTLVQRLESQERWLAARIEGVRSIKTAFGPLYATLSADQTKTADELMGMHMGLMPSRSSFPLRTSTACKCSMDALAVYRDRISGSESSSTEQAEPPRAAAS